MDDKELEDSDAGVVVALYPSATLCGAINHVVSFGQILAEPNAPAS
jgi:hypothetical protein